MPIRVELPNGRIVEFPDGTSQAQIQSAVGSMRREELVANANPISQIRDIGGRAVGGLVSTLGGAIDMLSPDAGGDVTGAESFARKVTPDWLENATGGATPLGIGARAVNAVGRGLMGMRAAAQRNIGAPLAEWMGRDEEAAMLRADGDKYANALIDANVQEDARRKAAGLPSVSQENRDAIGNRVGGAISDFGQDVKDYWTSEESRAQQQDIGQAIQKDGARGIANYLGNPLNPANLPNYAALGDMVAPSLLEFAAPGGLAGRAVKAGRAAEAAATVEQVAARAAAEGVDELTRVSRVSEALASAKVAERGAETAARNTMLGVQTAQTTEVNARDNAQQILSAPIEELRKNADFQRAAEVMGEDAARDWLAQRTFETTFGTGLPVNALLQFGAGAVGAQPFESAVAGAGRGARTGMGAAIEAAPGVRGRALRMMADGAKEAAGEAAQEYGEQVSQNFGGIDAGLAGSLTEGAGAGAVIGAIAGGATGGMTGALSGAHRPPTAAERGALVAEEALSIAQRYAPKPANPETAANVISPAVQPEIVPEMEHPIGPVAEPADDIERMIGAAGGAAPGASRSNPLPREMEGSAPVGAWVAGPEIPGASAAETARVVMDVPIEQIDATEFTADGKIVPDKRADAERYAAAMRNGEQFPNARGAELPNGKIKLQDGHRRLAAAVAAGQKTLRVAVNPISQEAPDGQANPLESGGLAGAMPAAPGAATAPGIPAGGDQTVQPAKSLSEVRDSLAQRYARAEQVKPRFDADITEIAELVGGRPITADLKGEDRALAKITKDYASEAHPYGDVSQIKDLVRGTIEMPNALDAETVFAKLKEKYGEPIKLKNGLDPSKPPLAANGYRDINSVWMIDGEPVELQINLPEMLDAKKKAHPLYVEYSEIKRNAEGRQPTEKELAELDRLDAAQAEIYGAAWDSAMRRMNSSLGIKSASERNSMPGKTLPDGNERAVWRSSQASDPSGMTPNMALGENSAGSTVDSIGSTSTPIVSKTDPKSDLIPFPEDSGSLGIPRAQMPQIKQKDRDGFLKHLADMGITGRKGRVPAASLKPTQSEYSPSGVERFMQNGPMNGERAVLVSQDGYVLDGHHQWMAHRTKGDSVPAIRFNAPIRDLLAATEAFPNVQRSPTFGVSTDAAPAFKMGSAGEAFTSTNERIPFRYALAEESALVASNDPDGRVNPAYPQALQPRDRTSPESRTQVQSIAGNLQPERLGESADIVNGAPMVGPDGVVESGNGRVMALQSAPEPRRAAYRKWLRNNASRFGIDPEVLAGMKSPVLVRVREGDMSPEARIKIGQDGNRGTQQAMNPVESARADARLIDDDMMGLFLPSEDGDVLAASNQPFLRAFAQRIGGMEAAGLSSDGRWTKQMADRVNAAVFWRAYGDPRLLQAFAAEADPDMKNILSALGSGAREFALARSEGAADAGLDAGRLFADAVGIIRDARERGMSVPALLGQGSLFGNSYEPLAAKVAEWMAQNMRRHRQLGDALVEMGREIRAELSSRASGDMFDRADVGMTEIANEAIQRQADRNRDPQQGRSLFSEARRAAAPVDRQDQRQESGRGADAAAADAAPRREAVALQRHAARLQAAVTAALTIAGEGRKGSAKARVFATVQAARDAGFEVDLDADGFFDPGTGTVGIIAESVPDTARAMWIAFHEQSTHLGLRETFPDAPALAAELDRAGRNPTVRALADALAADRGLAPTQDGLAVEEALAELQAARRTGNWSEIADRYGVAVDDFGRQGIADTMRRMLRALRAALGLRGAKPAAYSDADVMKLLEDAHRAGLRSDGARGPGGELLESTVFHGTPHTVDRFSLQKIGTGEGAQAYGYGLYFASKKAIAEHYRRALSDRLNPSTPAQMLWNHDGTYSVWEHKPGDAMISLAREGLSRDEAAALVDEINAREKLTGNLYRVEVPEDSDLLDWDKPLSEQPEKVRAALASLGVDLGSNDPKGGAIYHKIGIAEENRLWDDASPPQSAQQLASEALLRAGIPGLRYLDGGSRAKGEGSANYVIWDESAIGTPESVLHSKRRDTSRDALESTEDQTQSEAFKRWFGDSVVTENGKTGGKPLVVYHGSPDARFMQEDATFRSIKDRYGERQGKGAFWFAKDLGTASSYADDRRAFDYQNAESGIVGAYLKMENPLVVDGGGKEWREAQQRGKTGDVIEAAQAAGNDGVIILNVRDDYLGYGRGKSARTTDTYVVFNSRQIKSADKNNGNFDADNPSILKSTVRAQAVPAARERAEARRRTADAALGNPTEGGVLGYSPARSEWVGWRGALRKTREAMQDKLISLRDTQQDIEAARGEALPDEQNVYRIENLMYGRVGKGMDALEEVLIEPLFKAMRRAKVTPEALEEYLYARHAKERNADLRADNPDIEAGSGMTDAEADAILANSAGLEPLAKMVDRITQDTRKRLYQHGVITKAQYEAMQAQFKHYVPLRGKEEADALDKAVRSSGMGGGGVELRGSGIKAMTGRNSRAVNILGEVIGDAQRSIISAEKARVGRALARLVLANPNPGLWTFEPVRTERAKDPVTGEVYDKVLNESASPDVVMVRIKGQLYRIQFANPKLAAALKNVGAENVPRLLAPLQAINRYVSATLTSYNPGFVAVNLARDAVFGSTRILTEHGPKLYGSTMGHYGGAVRALARAAMGKGEAPMLAEFLAAGGKTGWVTSAAVDTLQKQVRLDAKTGKVADAVRAAKAVAEVVEEANGVVENAMRLAYYSALRDAGWSADSAAEKAKDLTVNFNRQGNLGPWLKVAFLFYNPGVQGAHQVVKALKHPRMQGAMFALGLAQFSLAMLAAGYEDDDGERLSDQVPDSVKQRNLWLALPGDDGEPARIYTLPMPYGFNVFSFLGGRLAQAVTSDAKAIASNTKTVRQVAGDFTGGIAQTILQSFSPIPIDEGMVGLVPTIPLKAAVELGMNRDGLGRRIRNENPYDQTTPRAMTGKADTHELFKAAARGLNFIGLGDEYHKPMAPFDWAPEDIEYMYGLATGGAGRSIMDFITLGHDVATGQDRAQKPSPLIKSFTRPVNDVSAAASGFYERKSVIETDAAMVRDMTEAGGLRAGYAAAAVFPHLAGVEIKLDRSGQATIKPGRSRVYAAFKAADKASDETRRQVKALYGEFGTGLSAGRTERMRELQEANAAYQRQLIREWNAAADAFAGE